MMDILLDIRKRVSAESEDPLKSWQPYKDAWYEHARQNPSTIEFRQALEKLSQGERIQCFSTGIRALLKKPLSKRHCFSLQADRTWAFVVFPEPLVHGDHLQLRFQ